MKLAPVARALERQNGIEHIVVHTGQHYDTLMSETFFRDLGLARPEHELHVGSGTHGQQTAAILERVEKVCMELVPDWMLVYGDVNSTVAAALAAVKLAIRVGHVEAGLRSHDRSMPEEHNRVVTDHLAELLFTPSRDASENLRAEGITDDRIAFVGNVMIDTLVCGLPHARALAINERFGLQQEEYVLVTLHRPANVDDATVLVTLMRSLEQIAKERPVIFPVHPRTMARLRAAGFESAVGTLRVMEPLSYLQMLSLTDRAGVVITDSGGLQEETSFLGVPCVTVRPNTERPLTVTKGTNRLVPPTYEALVNAVLTAGRRRSPATIERWDGRAAERIANVLCTGAAID